VPRNAADLFPGAPRQVSLKRQIECVDRELGYRRHVYPKLVARGRFSQAKADDEIAVMEAVAATLRNLQQKDSQT
jgi:hypothetical protein